MNKLKQNKTCFTKPTLCYVRREASKSFVYVFFFLFFNLQKSSSLWKKKAGLIFEKVRHWKQEFWKTTDEKWPDGYPDH